MPTLTGQTASLRLVAAAAAALAGALLVSLALAAAPASGASVDDIISDCAEDGRVDSDATVRDLQRARRSLPADVREYTDCVDAIASAIARKQPKPPGGGTGTLPSTGAPPTDYFAGVPGFSSGAGGSAPTLGDVYEMGDLPKPSDAELAAADEAAKKGGGAVDVGGEKITPGSAGLDLANLSNELPQPLLIALIALGAGGLLAAIVTLGARVLGRRTA